MDRQDKLNVIADELQYWIDSDNAQQIEAVGKSIREDEKHIISPPSWPARGVLKEWIKALRPSAAPIKHIGPDALFGPGELESMRREQE